MSFLSAAQEASPSAVALSAMEAAHQGRAQHAQLPNGTTSELPVPVPSAGSVGLSAHAGAAHAFDPQSDNEPAKEVVHATAASSEQGGRAAGTKRKVHFDEDRPGKAARITNKRLAGSELSGAAQPSSSRLRSNHAAGQPSALDASVAPHGGHPAAELANGIVADAAGVAMETDAAEAAQSTEACQQNEVGATVLPLLYTCAVQNNLIKMTTSSCSMSCSWR